MMVDSGVGINENIEQKNIPNRYVCPNDRQLALRAKLRTGWSVKASTTTNTIYRPNDKTPKRLSPEEHATIIDVIRRAELINITEQERVGRLVERLETLRKNAMGRTPHQCHLCAERFRIFIGIQKVICDECKRAFCRRCTIETDNRWLCLICAETREIWKKSGAWFFQTIPKYVLPGDKIRAMATVTTMELKKDDENSSSDEDKSRCRRDSSTESTHDVPDSQATSNEIPNSLETRRESLNLSEWNWSECKSDERISPSPSSISTSVKSSIEESKSNDTPPPMGSIELSLNYDPLTLTLHCTIYRAKNLIPMDINGLADPFCKLNLLPNGKPSTRLRTKTVHKTRNPEFNENLTFYDIGEEVLIAKCLHLIVADDDKYGHDYMGETRIPLGKLKKQNTVYLSLALERLKGEPDDWFDDPWSRGQILLSLCYNTKRRALLVTVSRCVNLLPMDNNGFSDPFVKLHLKPDPYHRKHKTSIKWKNLNPIFNEEFAFETRPNELSTQSLYVSVWDKDYGKSNDYLGGLIVGGCGSKGQRLKHWLDMIRYPDHRHEAWHNLTEHVLD